MSMGNANVLAVLDEFALTYEMWAAPFPKHSRVTEAREAVAKLIEVSNAAAADYAKAKELADKAPKLSREILMGRVAIKHYEALLAALAKAQP